MAAERARQAEQAAAADLQATDAEWQERQMVRVRRALEKVRTSRSPMVLCDAALQQGWPRVPRVGPDLNVLLSSTTSDAVRAASRGLRWRRGRSRGRSRSTRGGHVANSDDLSRSAIGGFGDIGPTGASAALPHLPTALRSPYMDVRFGAEFED